MVGGLLSRKGRIGSSLDAGKLRFHIYRSILQIRRSHIRSKEHTTTNLGIGVAKLDGDVPNQLVLEPNSHNARDGFDDR